MRSTSRPEAIPDVGKMFTVVVPTLERTLQSVNRELAEIIVVADTHEMWPHRAEGDR